jgi:hypothetical protein
MLADDRDPSLDTLLDLDGQVFYMGDKGHRVQFGVASVSPTPERPHGLKYSLTVHAVPTTKGPGGKRLEYDHKHRFKNVRPYDYRDAAALLEDFWKLAEAVLKEEGVKI